MSSKNEVGWEWVNAHNNYSNQTTKLLGGMLTSALMMEKRQMFLRSYQFRRKKSVSEKMKRSLVRVKRLISVRIYSAWRFKRVFWSKVIRGFSLCLHRRRRRFARLRSPRMAAATSSYYCFS